MIRKHRSKFVQESGYVAEVDVELIKTDDGWSPYPLDDAYKKGVRSALDS
ncbi:MAG: hypothetical protein HY787_24105 [Deltaproteobacteria bacterium]|nr:hypothetical protein [Deltaproteobacteria bacterium]